MKKDLRLLSVDWDAFFPVPQPGDADRRLWPFYDWGHRETAFMMGTAIWAIRAVSFFAAGLPLPRLNGEEKDFWERVDIRGAEVFVAESHSMIAAEEVLVNVGEIVNFDAHHDAGYKPYPLDRILREGTVACDDWAVYASTVIPADITTIYPKWRAAAMEDEPPTHRFGIERRVDDGEHLGKFDRVFICRSGAWVPAWLDGEFVHFMSKTVTEHGASRLHTLEPLTARDFNEALAAATGTAQKRGFDWLQENAGRTPNE